VGLTRPDATVGEPAYGGGVSGTPAVLGVDGCRGGWVGALLVDDRVELLVETRVAALVDACPTRPVVVGVDIPIGLPDDGGRLADAAARRYLPPGRTASVFPTPARAAVAAATWQEANAANRAATGKGLSHQAFHLCARIAEVDTWVREGPPAVVLEVHPEVSFTAMGADTRPSKKTPDGRRERLDALRSAGIAPPEPLRSRAYAVDDVLDACAVAWTARRHARAESRALPDPPQVFSDGLPAAIHV
jgi:predicted RNase H-like nuclease